MMTTTRKRKGSPALGDSEESSKRRFAEGDDEREEERGQSSAPASGNPSTDNVAEAESQEGSPAPESSSLPPADDDAATTASPLANDSRTARFAALRARNAASRKSNLAETKSEARRSAIDTSALASLARKKDVAAHKLLQAEAAERGQDFERQRAWDWTVEESERWDERLAQKAENRQNNAFQDYAREAGKVYARQMGALEKGDMGERLAAYEEEKRAAIEKAVAGGGLEIVETGDGELIAVDRDGSFYSTADGAGPSHKPNRDAVDRLVADIKKAEEVRLKKRRERGRADAEDTGQDVTYINEKNKQFNQKLARFYNKYTAEIRESFERGTAM